MHSLPRSLSFSPPPPPLSLPPSLPPSLSLSQHLQSELQMASSDSNLSGGDGCSQTSPGDRDGNEIITQLLEHIVALKLVSY